eukprot:CAMPEP_0113404992 /NCGR_PEP_ID=MMETSP0013_2-20120614/18702_1 /TAXON_ID=2843 ORGANISM="Skeletonema costatum, Strain 1716" /NCGR_SAMPLE_ID=MMETSP0013_2 /ASSEMBLY_ACC=CAM_ASM_000158 /LENGTH=318 /DNA_ID=CAMNT_0000290665 /DNA_START=23 /DNA_END=979 /DNA_ORIENTATION=+ /assembly_acc=CAM_ASM_000158
MDAATLKAQRQIGSAPSTKSSKSKRNKKRRSKKSSQSAGQPSGPGNTAASLERSRRRQSDRFGDASSRESGADTKGKCTSRTLGALHTIDAGLGLACIVYGGMAHVVSVTALSVTYGLVLFIGAIAGAIGYYSEGCNKRGLTASAIAGLLTCLADIAAFVFVIISWGSFTTFLKENAEALLLTDASISTISSLQVLFAVIFIVLAGLEGSRFWEMRTMRVRMLAEGHGLRVSPQGAQESSKLSWLWCACLCPKKRKKTDDFVLFDDDSSLESALLWSKNGTQPTAEDYLEFMPEHEKGLSNFAASAKLPKPPVDRFDY